jgi:hypothetical protein
MLPLIDIQKNEMQSRNREHIKGETHVYLVVVTGIARFPFAETNIDTVSRVTVYVLDVSLHLESSFQGFISNDG